MLIFLNFGYQILILNFLESHYKFIMDHWADYIIFVFVLVASLGIGLFHAFSGGKQRTNEEFIMANRKLKIFPTAVSIIVSYMSALTIVGAPAEMYSRGVLAWPGYRIGGGLALVLLVFVIVPWLYSLRLTSVYSYFRLRYGNSALQIYTTLLGIVSSVSYTGISIYAPSIAMETATGFPASASIPIMAVVCTIYTTLGGMRAVIWTDVFQSLIMLAGIVAIMVKVVLVVGGVEKAFDVMKKEGRLDFDLSPDPTVRHTLWTFLIGAPFADACFSGLSQPSVQRYSALPSLKQAQILPVCWYVGNGLVSSLSFLTGLFLVAYYSEKQCDPVASHQIQNANQVIPLFVKESFKGIYGFSGLFLATMYSATLSTVSSSLSGASANAWTDLIKPRYPNLPEVRATAVSKALVAVFGILSTGFAFTVSSFEGPILAVTMALFSACNGPIGGMFTLAGLKIFRRVDHKAVLCGGLVGFAVNLWITLGSIFVDGKHPPLPPVSTDGCPQFLNTTTEIFGNLTGLHENSTISTTPPHLTGLDRFYTLSYLYYTLFGGIVTISVALLANLLIQCIDKQQPHFTPKEDVFISFSWRCKKTFAPTSQELSKQEGIPLNVKEPK